MRLYKNNSEPLGVVVMMSNKSTNEFDSKSFFESYCDYDIICDDESVYEYYNIDGLNHNEFRHTLSNPGKSIELQDGDMNSRVVSETNSIREWCQDNVPSFSRVVWDGIVCKIHTEDGNTITLDRKSIISTLKIKGIRKLTKKSHKNLLTSYDEVDISSDPSIYNIESEEEDTSTDDDLLGDEEEDTSTDDDLLGDEEEDTSTDDDLLGDEEEDTSTDDDLLGDEEEDTSTDDDLLGDEEEDTSTDDDLLGDEEEDTSTDDDLLGDEEEDTSTDDDLLGDEEEDEEEEKDEDDDDLLIVESIHIPKFEHIVINENTGFINIDHVERYYKETMIPEANKALVKSGESRIDESTGMEIMIEVDKMLSRMKKGWVAFKYVMKGRKTIGDVRYAVGCLDDDALINQLPTIGRFMYKDASRDAIRQSDILLVTGIMGSNNSNLKFTNRDIDEAKKEIKRSVAETDLNYIDFKESDIFKHFKEEEINPPPGDGYDAPMVF